MKKLLFAILLPFILVSCNDTENPVTNNSWSTDWTWTENISNSGNIKENDDSEDIEEHIHSGNNAIFIESPKLSYVFGVIPPIFQKPNSAVEKSTFTWRTSESEIKLDWYLISSNDNLDIYVY